MRRWMHQGPGGLGVGSAGGALDEFVLGRGGRAGEEAVVADGPELAGAADGGQGLDLVGLRRAAGDEVARDGGPRAVAQAPVEGGARIAVGVAREPDGALAVAGDGLGVEP